MNSLFWKQRALGESIESMIFLISVSISAISAFSSQIDLSVWRSFRDFVSSSFTALCEALTQVFQIRKTGYWQVVKQTSLNFVQSEALSNLYLDSNFRSSFMVYCVWVGIRLTSDMINLQLYGRPLHLFWFYSDWCSSGWDWCTADR